ncbi:MAG: MATE family efflux transporter [Ruminococcaceae bacterium]|nr:MATE family efflux transporter [Oscillospiraceae bacterium]
MISKNKRSRDFTEGPIFFKILLFVLPITLTGILQVLYNTADNVVVGRFSGDELALAAVGSTTYLTGLVTNFLIGIAAGSNVVVSRAIGAKDAERVGNAVHTSLTFAFLGGIAFMALGLIISRPALAFIGTKPEVLDKAVMYMRIICLGIPASAVYNFGAGVVRSTGDSRTPLLILSVSGIINVLLNLVFVLVFNMTVAGVATATIIAQYISAVRVICVLIKKKNECYGLRLNKLGINKEMLLSILRFGVPTGIQSSLFSISNVTMASAVNTMPTLVVSAKTISTNIESISNTAVGSFGTATVTFVGQNYGAKKPDRIKKAVLYSVLQVFICGFTISQIILLFGDKLASNFVDAANPNADQIIGYAVQIMTVCLTANFLNGIQQVLSASVRGMGYSVTSMIMSLSGACVFRILWVSFVFPLEKMNNIFGLHIVYPLSWGLTALLQLSVLTVAYRRFKKKLATEQMTE